MIVNVKCPSCGQAQQFPGEALGQKLSCPSCGAGFRIAAPKPNPAPPETIPLEPIPMAAAPAAPSPAPQYRPKPAQAGRPVPPAKPNRDDEDEDTRPGGFPAWAYASFGGGAIVVLVGIAIAARTLLGSSPIKYPDPAADIALGVVSLQDTPLAQSGPVTTPPVGAPAQPIAAPAQSIASMNRPAPTQAPGNVPPANTSTTAPAPPTNAALASSTTPNPVAPAPATTTPPTSPAPSTTPAPRAAGGTLTTAQIVAKSEGSVALVKGGVSSGTGFLVRPGIIATNSHVIDDEFISSLEVRFPSAPAGKQGPYPAELLYEDPKRDLAFLSVSTDLPALEVAPSYAFTKGEDITVIGNPGLSEDTVLENAISRGVMSSKVVLDGLNYFQMGISVNPGNSGGPVFDSAGRVIGVTTLKSSKQEALAFCIPVEDLQAALNQLGTPHPDQVSRHRANAAFKALSATGALYGIGLEIRGALLAQTPPGAKPNLLPNEGIQKLDEMIGAVDEKLSPPLEQELPGLQSDKNLPAGPRGRLQELMASYKAMKDLYTKTGQPADRYAAQVQSLRNKYVRLLESLQKDLNIPIPAELLAILKARVTAGQSQAMVAQIVPAPMQSRILRNRGRLSQRNAPGARNQPPSSPAQAARDRMQNLRDRARSRTRGNN